MQLEKFIGSLKESAPPPELNVYLLSLWYDANDDWNKAHHCVEHLNDSKACWVHAYLHRKEGDNWNADYWYRRANKKRPDCSLKEEWSAIAEALR